jgi:uncharacterized protein
MESEENDSAVSLPSHKPWKSIKPIPTFPPPRRPRGEIKSSKPAQLRATHSEGKVNVRVRLDRFCSQLDQSQADAQIVVVTIRTLDGADVADFAKELFNKWGIGHKGSNRGVLVLLAVNDRKYRIAVGYGLENILTDAKAAEIGRGAAPLLHVNDYDGGVSLLVDQLAQFIADEAKVKLNDAPEQPQQR